MTMTHEILAITPFATAVLFTAQNTIGDAMGIGVSTTILASCVAGDSLGGLLMWHDLVVPDHPVC